MNELLYTPAASPEFSTFSDACAPETSCPYRSHQEPITRNCGFQKLRISTDEDDPRSAGGAVLSNSQTISRNRINKRMLEVVAGSIESKSKEVTCLINGFASDCDTESHKKPLKRTSLNANNNADSSANSLKFKVLAKDADGFLQTLWPYKITPNRYFIKANSCEKSIRTVVNVYPDISWIIDGSITTNERGDLSPETIQINVVLSKNGSELRFEKVQELIRLICKIVDCFSKLVSFIIELTGNPLNAFSFIASTSQIIPEPDATRDANRSKFEILKPTIKLQFRWGWERQQGTSLCAYPIYMDLSADPLIGFNFQYDILDALCNLIGPLKVFIAQAKARFSRYTRFGILFICEGKINVKILPLTRWLGNASETSSTDFTFPASLGASLEVKLKGFVYAQAGVTMPFSDTEFYVQAQGEITASMGFEMKTMTFGVDSQRGWYMDAMLRFTGAKIVLAGVISTGSRVMTGRSQNAALRNANLNQNPPENPPDSFSSEWNKELGSIDAKEFGTGRIYFDDLNNHND